MHGTTIKMYIQFLLSVIHTNLVKHTGMTHVKFVARQANSVNLYKNCRSKLLKCCANIYFNKHCLLRKVIPKYAKLNFGNSSPAVRVTTKKAQITRIK